MNQDIEHIKNKFTEGSVVRHKATYDTCVVIEVNNDGLVVVRTQKNDKMEYYPQELETEAEERARINSQMPKNPFEKFDPYGI